MKKVISDRIVSIVRNKENHQHHLFPSMFCESFFRRIDIISWDCVLKSKEWQQWMGLIFLVKATQGTEL